MSSSAGNDDEDFDLYLASKPSDRAKRYEGIMGKVLHNFNTVSMPVCN